MPSASKQPEHSGNQKIAQGFRHCVRAIARPKFGLCLLKVAAHGLFAQTQRLCSLLQRQTN